MKKAKNYSLTFKETRMSIPLKSHCTSTKKSKVVFGKVTESNITRRIRERNERIIEGDRLIRNGPFGLFQLLKRYKR